MPKEIKILLPDSSANEIFDILIKGSYNKNIPSYRFEIWDLEKDNPDNLLAANFIIQKIKTIEKDWIIAEVFKEENKKIPILLKQKLNN
ncbi:MAG: hypothetical protein J7K39_11140 [Bacteroidales bacterium]|nr:hypothetical protein [Bacteroidales bacterium]RLD38396.1 MAG: hypothetical protein DRI74_04030 [Bacteroidota bacterium]